MATLLHTEITIAAPEALRVLHESDKLDTVQLLIDVANPVIAKLDLYVDGSGTGQTIILKEDGTWKMTYALRIGELP